MLHYKTEYVTVYEDSPSIFDETCNKLASEGWIPAGPMHSIQYPRGDGQSDEIFHIQQWSKTTPDFKYLFLTDRDCLKWIGEFEDGTAPFACERNDDVKLPRRAIKIQMLRELIDRM